MIEYATTNLKIKLQTTNKKPRYNRSEAFCQVSLGGGSFL
jgi:hypothetical protein